MPAIRAKFGPAPADDPELRRLIAGLTAERHVVRRACFDELAARGAEAGPALRSAAERTTSPLARRQLEALADLPTAARPPNDRRLDRADWALQVVGTKEAAEARRVLAAWRAPER